MRLALHIVFYWSAIAAGVSIFIGRALRAMPPAKVVQDDWLAEVPVDVLSDEEIDDRFMALVSPLDWDAR